MVNLFRIALVSTASFAVASAAHAFDTPAEHAVILDYDSGVVLYEKDARAPMIPASMTKMMTVHLVFERLADGRLSLDDEFTVSENAWRKGGTTSGGSTMFLSPNTKVRVEDLLKGVIVQSGNDACITIAENISGSEAAFAEEMTAKAQELGLTTAHFRNATGLNEEGHEISALDLAKLARHTIEAYPEYYKIYAIKKFEWGKVSQSNRNPLLSRFEGADGLKTGHLGASGYGLVGSAVVDGKRRIIVINGTESEKQRGDVAETVMRAAFREFDIATPFKAGEEIARAAVWLGDADDVGLTIQEDQVFGVEVAQKRALTAEVALDHALKAPLAAGQPVGRLIISDKSGVVKEAKVIVAEPVGRAGLLARALEGFSLMVNPPKTDTAPLSE